jgi:hypothetical protein
MPPDASATPGLTWFERLRLDGLQDRVTRATVAHDAAERELMAARAELLRVVKATCFGIRKRRRLARVPKPVST